MNKRNKKIVAIVMISIMMIGYVAYSDISAYMKSQRIEPKMITEKEMLSILHIHKYVNITWGFYQPNFTNCGNWFNAVTCWHVLINSPRFPNHLCYFTFCDQLRLFDNRTGPFDFDKIFFNPLYISNYSYTGNVDFTFYVPNAWSIGCMINYTLHPQFKSGPYFPKEKISCRLGTVLMAINFTSNNEAREVFFNVPFTVPRGLLKNDFLLYAKIAEEIFTSVKNVSYSTLANKPFFF